MGESAIGDVEIRPGIFVPVAMGAFLVERLQWIEEGEEGDFQVLAPPGFEFHDLCTLALFLAKKQWGLAKEMVANLPPPAMGINASANFQGGNDNYLLKNPFSRRRRRRERKMREGGEKRIDRPASSDENHTNEDCEKEESSHLSEGDTESIKEFGPLLKVKAFDQPDSSDTGDVAILQLQFKVSFCFLPCHNHKHLRHDIQKHSSQSEAHCGSLRYSVTKVDHQ